MANNFAFISKWFEKLKKIKHIEIYTVILLGLFLLGFWLLPGDSVTTSSTTVGSQGQTSTAQYATTLENRLNSVLSSILGAGSVQCMITLDGEVERVLAYSDDQKNSSSSNTSSSGTTNTSETSTSSKEPILVSVNGKSEPLVLYEIMPDVKGVVVVASGAGDVRVRLDILKAIQALLNVESSQIEIFVKDSK